MISDNKLYYSEEKWEEDSPEVSDSLSSRWSHFEKFVTHFHLLMHTSFWNIQNDSELHLSEPWFHGPLAEGRITAEKLLRDFCQGKNGKDGTFLVQESEKFIRNYRISLWYLLCPAFHYSLFYNSINF